MSTNFGVSNLVVQTGYGEQRPGVLQYNRAQMDMAKSKTSKNDMTWQSQLLKAAIIGLLLFVVSAGMLLIGYELSQQGKIFPGVSMAGIDLSGLTPAAAAIQIREKITYPSEGKLLFIDNDRTWLATPAELGLTIDPIASAHQAYLAGRGDGLIYNIKYQLQAWRSGLSIAPTVIYDQRAAYQFLQNIANQIDIPVIEARLGVEGAEVVVNAGQIGRKLDITSSLDSLEGHLQALQDGLIPLVVEETPPVIMDVGSAAELAKKILSQSLILSLPSMFTDTGPWTITPEELAGLLIITRQDNDNSAEYTIGLDPDLLIIYLSSLAPTLSVEPVNAHYIFNDETSLLEVREPAVIGRTLNVPDTLNHINTQLLAGEHIATLQMDILDPPAKDDTTGESLGITELAYAYTSYFYGSDPARVQNIAAAAKSFHGLLIPPGATFSMASALGNISLDNGYAEALIIVGNQTIKGVGGGVCQVSTTLFRTVFFAGFPIVERYAHAYRVSYYEQRANGSKDPSLAGLDATVYVPLVDLRFTNDTPYWLLMETYMGNYSLTWKFYSTKDGRSVQWNTSGVTNVVKAPEPLYRENPDLDKGVIKQVDWAADGAYVRVTRTVMRDDRIHFEDAFTTQYRPWQAIYEYGPGTEGIPTPTPSEGD